MFYVYSLKCKDGFYVGCTDDIQERIERHKKGQVPATADRLQLEIEFYNPVQVGRFSKSILAREIPTATATSY